MVEDYVATQLTLIKSEKIRRAAAKELRQAQLDLPLPEDELAAAEAIKGGLDVKRDKDTSSANQIGSGIVNLSYKNRDPQDAKRILEAVIHAYRQELGGVFDQATKERIERHQEDHRRPAGPSEGRVLEEDQEAGRTPPDHHRGRQPASAAGSPPRRTNSPRSSSN